MKRFFLCVFLLFFLCSCTPAKQRNEPIPPQAETVDSDAVRYVRSKVDYLRIRTEGNTDAGVLGLLRKGDMVAFVEEKGDWYQTYYCNQIAYVSAKKNVTELVFLPKGDADTENVITEGTKLLGTPYCYGAIRLHDGQGNFLKGFSDEAFDCSSLMQYIFYYGKGELLDVTTRTQAVQGISVSTEELQRGDLIFMTNASRKGLQGVERIGHVALYLGNNYILHTASDHAVIEEMSATRWANIIECRRI